MFTATIRKRGNFSIKSTKTYPTDVIRGVREEEIQTNRIIKTLLYKPLKPLNSFITFQRIIRLCVVYNRI